MATLSASHPDLLDFLTAKTLDREADEGDIGTFNISVLVDDDFMLRVENGNTHENYLMHTIAEQAWATGEPGLLFVDTINSHNMLYPTHGPILASNPCGEIGLYPGEPCDLGAVNLSAYVVDGTPQYRQLEADACRYAEYLDRILDVEVSPLDEIHEAIQSKRRIGLGMMGLADALIKMGLRYDSPEGLHAAEQFAVAIRDGAHRYTTVVAGNQGRGVPFDVLGAGFSRRNVAALTVAPTGTTAMVMGTTSGIEPLFAPFIYRRIGTEYKQILHPLFKEHLNKYPPHPARTQWGFSDDNFQPIGWNWTEITEDISRNHGSVQGISYIPAEVQDLFVCAHDIDPLDHVAMQAAVQNAFDWKLGEKTYLGNSISKTINLSQKATVKDVTDVYWTAWASGLKGITVYRDGSRGLQVLNTSLEDDGSNSHSQADDEQLGEILAATCSLDGGGCDL
jgi:ribonucleoside-diphosphate reductase alpha chain